MQASPYSQRLTTCLFELLNCGHRCIVLPMSKEHVTKPDPRGEFFIMHCASFMQFVLCVGLLVYVRLEGFPLEGFARYATTTQLHFKYLI